MGDKTKDIRPIPGDGAGFPADLPAGLVDQEAARNAFQVRYLHRAAARIEENTEMLDPDPGVEFPDRLQPASVDRARAFPYGSSIYLS